MTSKLAYRSHCKRIGVVQKIVGIYSIEIGKLNTEQSCQSVLFGLEFTLFYKRFYKTNFLSKTLSRHFYTSDQILLFQMHWNKLAHHLFY